MVSAQRKLDLLTATMSRNRFMSTVIDVNRFRSNLMLLIHNLYTDGIPLANVQTEYRKYFHIQEDINLEALSKSLGLRTIDEGTNQDLEETEIWLRVFNIPCLYEFFYVEDITITAKTEDDTDKTVKVVKCRRGRTIVEMQALAQLAAFQNIEYVRANCKGKSSEDFAFSLWNQCTSVSESSLMKNLDSKSNPLKRKRNPQKENPDLAKPNKTGIACTNVPNKINNPQPIPVTSPGTMDKYFTSNNSDFNTTGFTKIPSNCYEDGVNKVAVPTSTKILQPSIPPKAATRRTYNSDVVASSLALDPKVKHSTVLLKNHKGETKVIHYVEVEYKCSMCSSVFPNEVLLSRHRKFCVANLRRKCRTCGMTLSSILQSKVHEDECAAKGHHLDKINIVAKNKEPSKVCASRTIVDTTLQEDTYIDESSIFVNVNCESISHSIESVPLEESFSFKLVKY